MKRKFRIVTDEAGTEEEYLVADYQPDPMLGYNIKATRYPSGSLLADWMDENGSTHIHGLLYDILRQQGTGLEDEVLRQIAEEHDGLVK